MDCLCTFKKYQLRKILHNISQCKNDKKSSVSRKWFNGQSPYLKVQST